MKEFWDARAREDAFYFVDNTGRYGDADLNRFWASGEETLETMLEAVDGEIAPGDSIVEIGCGVGRMTRALANRAGHVRALDVSSEMVRQARELNLELGNVEFIVGDGSTLSPIADSSADVCHSHVVFQHIPDPAITLSYIREIGRILRPGGWAFFQVSNAPEIHRPRRSFDALGRSLKARLGKAPKGQTDPAWLGSAIKIGELRDAAAVGGTEVGRLIGEGTQFCLVRLDKPVELP